MMLNVPSFENNNLAILLIFFISLDNCSKSILDTSDLMAASLIISIKLLILSLITSNILF